MKVKPLVEAILAASAFLEQGSDDEVDPDWAVKTLESMAHHVGQVPQAELPELLAVFDAVAVEAEQAGRAGWAQFVRTQPFSFGLTDDAPEIER